MIVFAAHLAAAVALLLWAIRLIRTGVERAFMPELKQGLKGLSKNSLSASLGGGLAAMVLQSSAAVALIGAGFAASGMLASHSALALLLGADLGTALMARVLVLPVEAVLPFALLAGVVTFSKARSRKAKQLGRIAIGFALTLMALGLIRDATAPIAQSDIVRSIAAYLQSDPLSAYALGALFAWAMHSSLATVLTLAAFATTGLIAGELAAALVIGANLGGALIPYALLRGGERPARIVVFANLLARGGVTLIFLGLLLAGALPLALLGADAGVQTVTLHILLNSATLLLVLPILKPFAALAERLFPRHPETSGESVTALDEAALDHTPLALACAQRELLRMAETVQAMLVPAMRLLHELDAETTRKIALCEDRVDQMHFETKIYVSQLRERDLSPAEEKKTLEAVAMANNLEEAADRIAVNFITLATRMRDEALTFSDQGLRDLENFHDQVVTNGQLALQVLTTGDAEAARQLVAEKDRIRVEEQRLQERHLKRLQDGTTASIETSNIHQEVLRLLKQINAAMGYVAYPIAEETGDLLTTRLAQPRKAGAG
ncbi:MAG: Na/Pi cotransporter family protein [Silicimonas sp.]|nr:Na/Pi cotransporter family protein [Silicimonas sp.]